MNEFRFLTEEEIWGIDQLEIFKKYGIKMAVSDFSILLGGFVNFGDNYTLDGKELKDRAGAWWTASKCGSDSVRVVSSDGDKIYTYSDSRNVSNRLVLPYSKISQGSLNLMRGVNGISEIEYGEYPQQVVEKELAKILELEYQAQNLEKTDRIYTTDSRNSYELDENFQPIQHSEFEYNGKRYVRVIAKLNENPTIITNGVSVNEGDAIWVEVEPIRWLVDEKNKILVSKRGIYAGLQFDMKTAEYEASAIKIFNELRFGVECTESQIAPEEYVLGKKYKRIPANAFNCINGLGKIIIESQIEEIGVGTFKGFSYISKQKDGKLVVSKDKIQDTVWEFNISDREFIHIIIDSSNKPTIYIKNKYGNVDLIAEEYEERNICDINTFIELRKQNLIEKLDDWISLRNEYKSKSPLFMEVLYASGGDTKLYKKFFESKVTGFDRLIKREWYGNLSIESKGDLMKFFISLGGFEKTGQKDVLIVIDKLQEAYGEGFNNELHHLFMNVPKGDKHIFGSRDGKEGIFSFSKTILNFIKRYEGQYNSCDFKNTVVSIVSDCPKIYQAYRKNLRNLNPNYNEAANPNADLYEKTKSEGLSIEFILQWLSGEKYTYLDNKKLKQRFMHLPQGVTISRNTALYYEQLLDRDIPQIIESVKKGKRKRNKCFVNQIDDGREVCDNNHSGIHYEWAEINRINALTCGEFMQTCFRPDRANRYAFWNCIDNPEDAFMLLYDGDQLSGYCRVRYYQDRKGILVDNVELSHYAGDIFTDNQRREFAKKCLKGLFDMACEMNEIGYPVERIYSKQDSWADKVILDEWKKQYDTVSLKNVNPMQEVRYNSSRGDGSYEAGSVGEQIVIMEGESRGRKS